MSESVKKGKFLLTGSYSRTTHLKKGTLSYNLRIQDAVSGNIVLELDIAREDFLPFLASQAAIPASGELCDAFRTFGKRRETKVIELDVEPIKGVYGEEDKRRAINRAFIEHTQKHSIEEGWEVSRNGHTLVGAFIDPYGSGCVFIRLERYVDVDPEDERPMEDAAFGGYK